MSAPPLSPEQRAAVERRRGSLLLAAGAGAGKTAVIVERFVSAARDDGVPVSGILCLTFTEKAAGELRERVRARFRGLGDEARAREVERAWVGTIHSFCARLLRAHPLAAGVDPRFAVLTEAAAERLARAAFADVLDPWLDEHGDRAREVAAAYGIDGLRELVLAAAAVARSRGHERLVLPRARPRVDPAVARAAVASARGPAVAALAATTAGPAVSAGLRALAAADELLSASPADVPPPARLASAVLPGGRARALAGAEVDAYRTALERWRIACADAHGAEVVRALDALGRRFDAAYAARKRDRGALDFDDLELRATALLGKSPALRRRWQERFALIMVDEFQDTNRVQLALLERLERDNAFVVGDEFQSIYGFRHADVEVFRARRRRLGPQRVLALRANFRSTPALVRATNAAFAPLLGRDFRPARAGRSAPVPAGGGDGHRAPGQVQAPAVEVLVTHPDGWDAGDLDARLGLAATAPRAASRAEARLLAQRVLDEVRGGRRPGEVAVLVRAAASLALFERALTDCGLPTHVAGGRGFWAQSAVRDALAYLRVVANPLDEEALFAALASPFAGVGADALVLLARAARAGRDSAWAALRTAFGDGAGTEGAWAAPLASGDRRRLAGFCALVERERPLASRLPVDVLLQRALAAVRYATSAAEGLDGERHGANLDKLRRLAREHERAEGRDLRGFVAYARAELERDAREGEAALQDEGADAVRLGTIHAAKGLEFPVVCLADLSRCGNPERPRLLVGADGRVGVRVAAVDGAPSVPALDWEALAAERDRLEDEEERRLFYVGATRARELLVLSATGDPDRWPAPRPRGAPAAWLVPAFAGDPAAACSASEPDRVLVRPGDGEPVVVRCLLNAPRTLGRVLRAPAPPPADPPNAGGSLAPAGATQAGAPDADRFEAPPRKEREPGEPAVVRPPLRLSYSSLSEYGRCPYRFYLQRVLRLPDDPGADAVADDGDRAPGLDGRVRGVVLHALLERLDFGRPLVPRPEAVGVAAAAAGTHVTAADAADLSVLVAALAGSPVVARLARARRVQREAPFRLALGTGPEAPLLEGVLDVVAWEGNAALVVDWKSDRVDPDADLEEIVARAYATQRAAYALAGLRAGAARVEVAHVFAERPATPAAARFAAGDVPALEAALLAAADGMRRGDFPVAERPHAELCSGCPGRAALCSWDPAATGRSRREAYASAGTFSGSGGPS